MSRRLIGIPISIELFEKLLWEGQEIKVRCTKGLPEGAKMTNSYYDGQRQTAVLIYEHESFEPVLGGAMIPLVIAEFTRLD